MTEKRVREKDAGGNEIFTKPFLRNAFVLGAEGLVVPGEPTSPRRPSGDRHCRLRPGHPGLSFRSFSSREDQKPRAMTEPVAMCLVRDGLCRSLDVFLFV